MEDGTTATFTMQEDIGVLAKFSTLEEEDSSADFGPSRLQPLLWASWVPRPTSWAPRWP